MPMDLLPARMHRPRHPRAAAAALVAGLLALLGAVPARTADDGWTPSEWADADTLEMRTVGPEEGPHWSMLWLVVLDGEVYVRLGNRAVTRVQQNTEAPYAALRIAGREFDRVKIVDAPEMTERVAAAMAEKYWTDKLIRFAPHPMTARLELVSP
jgi:hypothetical protein